MDKSKVALFSGPPCSAFVATVVQYK